MSKPVEDPNSVAYCMKCRKSVAIKDKIDTKLKNGRPAISGKCSVCSCNVFKIKRG